MSNKFGNPFIDALYVIRPMAKYTFNAEHGITYEGLEWLDEVQTKPSKAQVDVEIQRQIDEEYKELRAPEYPPLSDLADAIYWQENGDATKMTAYLAKVQAVKTKYPKV